MDRLVLVKGRAGLGNRILAALGGILYARLSDRRLIVDWRDQGYSDGTVNAFRHYFDCPLLAPTDDIPPAATIEPPVWRGNLHETSLGLQRRLGRGRLSEVWREFSFDLGRIDHDADVLVMWAFTSKIHLMKPLFVGRFAHLERMRIREITRTLLRQDLTPRPVIRARVDRFRADHFAQPTLGVHVRYTDHRTRLHAIVTQVERVLAANPGLQVFLATDNAAVLDLFRRRFSPLVSTPHWLPPAGQALHSNPARPDRLESGVEALVDLYLLASCEHLVIDTSSTFALLAELLSAAPPERIVDVHGGRNKRKRAFWLRARVDRMVRWSRFAIWFPALLGALGPRRGRS